MTVYTHSFVGLGLGVVFGRSRMPPLYWTLAATLPIIPDLDAFSVASYGDSILGHRGITHTLVFAVAVGIATAALVCRRIPMRFWMLAVVFSLITASHAILDAFTHGGAGIPFFWPISDHRFGGWGPVLVPDVAMEIPDPRTSRAIRGELLWVWLPMGVLLGALLVCRHLRRDKPGRRAA